MAPSRSSFRPALLLVSLAVAALSGGCAGGPSPGGTGGGWDALLAPRPEPLQGAPRLTVSEFLIVASGSRGLESGADPGLTLSELVAAGLLRRSDVHFVERRRFSRAAERVRRGLPRPSGAPPVGRSPGAELILAGSWAPVDSGTAALSLRLTDAETGDVVRSWRVETPAEADPVSLARTTTGSLLSELDQMDRMPDWDDPLEARGTVVAPSTYRRAGVPVEAVSSFARGLAAEERYAWEEARRAYESALEAGGEGFFEARVALARIARLRAGGTLGASD